jgi:hypothetical protein
MTDETAYTPPKGWIWNKENGGDFDTKTQDKVAAGG